MADSDSKSYAKRRLAVELARSQIGAHYVNGAAGNRPGEHDGAWYRPDAVKMYKNEPLPGGKGAADGRVSPIVQSAYCKINGFCICGGRSALSSVKALPVGNLDEEIVIFDNCKWPRPDKYIHGSKTIYGESCEGVRHFDCIGFVNWCLSLTARKVHYGIEQIQKKKADQASEGKLIALSDVRAGDLLLKGTKHIAIATGEGTVVEASGYTRGVKETKVEDASDHDGSPWDFVYRLPNWFWN
ncbi:MAG: NlpC/P60 family protein [Isosphaeraceae bacterium]|nr:NlpC/P60 family protein [Isosphaeraceae bacterium]